MEKEKKAKVRKLRKKAIKMQNNSPAKITMAEALNRLQVATQDSL
jgi:hypothetical protein